MGSKIKLIISFIVIGVVLYYIYKIPDYKWLNVILIATSIYFGVCYEKNRERQGEVAKKPPSLPSIPEEYKMEQQFPVR